MRLGIVAERIEEAGGTGGSPAVSFPDRCAVALACLLAFASSSNSDLRAQSPAPKRPSSQPTEINHQKFYEDAKRVPLAKPLFEKENGTALTAEEMKEYQRSEDLLAQADKLRADGKFAEGIEPATQALMIRKKLFGALHPYTVTAIATNNVMRRFAAARESEQIQLKEADDLQRKAEADLEKGEFASAASAARKALDLREQILGKNYFELGDTLRVLGAAYTELSDYSRAGDSFTRGVEIVEKAYGDRHPKRALILDRRGWYRINTGDARGAIEDLQTACRIYKNLTGDTVEAAEAMDNLGTASAAANEIRDAIDRKIRSLIIRETLLGPEARDTAVSYSNLAWLYARLGASQQVIPMREKALAIFEKVLGPDHPYTSTELVNLGLSYQQQNRHEDAIKLYEKAVKLDDERKAPPDVKLVARASRLAVAYLEAGRREEGLRAMQNAVAKAEAVYKNGNPDAATEELQKIAIVFENYRALDQAVTVLRLADRWDQERKLAPKDSRIGRSERLGTLLTNLGRPKEGQELLSRTLDEANKLYGKGDKRTGPVMLALVFACIEAGDLARAEEVCDEVLRLSESQIGAGSKANAFALRTMAMVHIKQKRYDLAKISLDDARKIIEAHQDDDPVEMIRFLLDYTAWQSATGDRTGSVESARDAVARCRKLATTVKTLHMDGLTARALKRLVDQLAASPSPSAREIGDSKAELRGILERLQAQQALDAEEARWLQELGSPSAKSPAAPS